MPYGRRRAPPTPPPSRLGRRVRMPRTRVPRARNVAGLSRLVPVASKFSRAIPYVGGAIAAADMMYQGYNAYQSYTKTKTKTKKKKQNKKGAKSSNVRFNTQGTAGGVLVAASNTKDYALQKKFAKKGAVLIIENGGILSSPSISAIYPFHGIATNQVCRIVFRAIVKELARQRSTDIVNWTDPMQFIEVVSDNDVQFYWQNKPGTNTPTNAFATTAYNTTATTLTWAQFADALLNHWQLNSGAGDQAKELIRIQMRKIVRDANNTGAASVALATIHMKQVKMDFDIVSYLTVQNRTLAENANVDNDRDEADDIENQPLVGKTYSNAGKWSNYLELHNKGINSGNQGQKSTVCDRDTGLVLFQVGNEYVDTMRIPPPGWVLGFKNDNKIVINPGKIYTQKVKFTCQMSFNKFQMRFAHTLGNAPTNPEDFKTEFGFVAGFGLEKLIDAQRNAGSDINIGYQIKQVYGCGLVYSKRSASNPALEISGTAINYSTDKPT